MYFEEGYTKAMMQFVKLAAKWGAKPIKTTGKHLKFRDALGHQISAPKTSSDWRALKNFKSELRNRGFKEQETVKKVKDVLRSTLVNNTKTTTLQPSRKTSGQQTTFKKFTQKYQPNVQGPKRSELQVQADNIIRSLQSNKRASKPVRRTISRAQLDAMDIPQKQKDALIRQGLVENKFRYAAQLMKKAGIGNYDDLVRTVSDIKRLAADKVIKQLQTKPVQTGKGRELQRRMGRAYDRNKDKHPGLFEQHK